MPGVVRLRSLPQKTAQNTGNFQRHIYLHVRGCRRMNVYVCNAMQCHAM